MTAPAAANWSWSIGPWKAGASTKTAFLGAGGPLKALTSAPSRSLKVRLLDPSTADVTLSGYGDDAALIEELITDLWVYRNGVGVFRGRITGPTKDTLAADGYSVAVTAVDYRGVLERRLLYADLSRTAVEQSTTVWDLILDTHNQPGGDLGLTKGTWPTTGVVRTTLHTAGDSIWDSIKKLGAMTGGFEFDVDVDLAAHLYYPQRGVDNGVNLDYGGVVAAVDRSFDPAGYANAIRQSGADGVTPVTAVVDDIATTPEGRWDAQYSDTQLNTTQMVADTAGMNLARASMPLPSWTLRFAPGRWGGPGHVWVGDWATVVVKAGRLLDVVKARVYEMHIDLDANNREHVSAVVGDVRRDRESVLRGIGKRVAALAKR